MNTQILSFSQMVKAPPAEVYRAFTNATALREWLCNIDTASSREWTKSLLEIEKASKKGLENLASVLETGEDLRFVLRPMLGIFFGDYDADKAKGLGVA